MAISLHTHSAYSLLDGASRPYDLIKRGSELGYVAIALTDHDSVSGVWEFQRLALDAGIKPIIGCEVTLEDGSHLTLIAENYTGYQKICSYLNMTDKADKFLPHGEGIFALSGCRNSKLQRLLLRRRYKEALELAKDLYLFFEGRFFIEMTNDLLPRTNEILNSLDELGKELQIPTVASVDVHYACEEDFPVHDSLSCIRLGIKLEDVHPERSFNNAGYLCSPDELVKRFSNFSNALQGMHYLAEICESKPLSPPMLLPSTPGAKEKLREIALAGLEKKYGTGNRRALARLEHELSTISALGYDSYFLLVHDLICEARRRNIAYQGRGSAAGSLVSYCLDLTQVDPIEHNLVFERFLSVERGQQPDIDIDFDWAKRDQLWDYLEGKYGSSHVASIAAFHCYREDMARNDLLRIGLSPELIPQLTGKMYGLPRHIATHSSGIAIASEDLSRHAPLVEAATGRKIVALDKDDIEEIGIVKLDLLSLRTLGALSELNLPIKPEDPATYKMLQEGKSLGVFQLESPAQRSLQQRLKPERFSDVVASVALIRPGPIRGNMVEPYIKRHNREEEASYPAEELKPYLEKTFGLIVFQEQIIQIVSALGGFSPGESDKLRKMLSNKKRERELYDFHVQFVERAVARGVPEDTAESIFQTLEGFSGYGFCEAHSASFAQTAYKTAFLRCHYPAEFFGALINNQPLGYYLPQSLLWEAKRLGVKVVPLDINKSPHETYGKDSMLYLGLKLINGFSAKTMDYILENRPLSLEDIKKIPSKERRLLVLSGALDSFGQSRRSLLWEAWGTKPIPGDFTPWERFLREIKVLDLSPSYHVMHFFRPKIPNYIPTADEVFQRQGRIQFAGQILRPHRPPTKSGKTVVFFVMEDETGQVDVTYFPRENHQISIREGGIAVVTGTIDQERKSIILEGISYLGRPVANPDLRQEV